MSVFYDVVDQDGTITSIMQAGKVPEEVCGTACCIAGEVGILFPKEMRKVTKRLMREGVFYKIYGDELAVNPDKSPFRKVESPMAIAAAEVIGVDPKAFFVEFWPEEYGYNTFNPGNHTEIAKKVIDHYTLPARRKLTAA